MTHSLTGADIRRRTELCQAVAREAGARALAGFRRRDAAEIAMKGPQDYLTETDSAVERHLRGAIAGAFPEDGFLGEETGGGDGDGGERVWVVDPIDGTANFARHNPHFCVSIAFVAGGVVRFGAIYAPVLDELYFAEAGGGAFRNGDRLTVAGTDRFDAATIELGWSRRLPDADYLDLTARLLAEGANPRRAGSGALGLAYVADGRADAYLEKHMNAWDCLAGLLLVEEAGGTVNDFLGTGSLTGGGPVLASVPGFAAALGRIAAIPLREDAAAAPGS